MQEPGKQGNAPCEAFFYHRNYFSFFHSDNRIHRIKSSIAEPFPVHSHDIIKCSPSEMITHHLYAMGYAALCATPRGTSKNF
ncbi:hypothetical protein Mp_4g19230 [Marchantia polymorpha subsp. ruderalis]|uniref:Uncharacterized protein n=2 Tax=Marchantia polymorpha TaxID=3197 RepID=A0AAF6BBI4_MARPO|nr:hypothetical protein MARPO_0169s0022 [Marchantia polymorpha]BBN09368.1 hypothetical protein Mp_4g19230 [Marchantia polymorpha subsp. ruderalis]|eukprot:PTQ28262.1 hypothetical protein MARPO_0169s0022 [Marchantia polymorpha]